MLGIVFTTPSEASAFLDRHTDGRTDPIEAGTPRRVDDLVVLVAGPGKIKATLSTERLLEAYDLDTVIHAGTGVSLDEDLAPGTVMGASFVLEGDRVELDDPAYPRMPLTCPLDVDTEGTLVSQDHSRDDSEELSYWERLADLRDTTGYPVAYVAAQHGTTCHIVKGVARHTSDDEERADAEANVAVVLEQFLETSTSA